MLILSRKCGEAVWIGEDIEITVTEILGDKVKIGISAPTDCKIWRKELYQTVQMNRQAAAGTLPREMLGLLKKREPADEA